MKTQTNTVPLSPKDFDATLKWLTDNEVYFICGANSMYVPSSHHRYVNQNVARTWDNIDGLPELMTPGQAARTELQRAFPGLKRVGWSPKMIKLFDARPPMHYSGSHHGDMVQIDLKGAYHQIYSLLWLNTPYPRGFGSLALWPVGDALRDWKAARNSVIGLCASRTSVGIKGVVRYTLRTRNPFLSPGLWASVQDTLHAIADVALDHGALYINTDGYIFYDRSPWQYFIDWLNYHGFQWEFKGMGEGHITGWNSYSVDDRQTQIYRLNLGVTTYEHSNIKRTQTHKQIRFINQCRALIASSRRAEGSKT